MEFALPGMLLGKPAAAAPAPGKPPAPASDKPPVIAQMVALKEGPEGKPTPAGPPIDIIAAGKPMPLKADDLKGAVMESAAMLRQAKDTPASGAVLQAKDGFALVLTGMIDPKAGKPAPLQIDKLDPKAPIAFAPALKGVAALVGPETFVAFQDGKPGMRQPISALAGGK